MKLETHVHFGVPGRLQDELAMEDGNDWGLALLELAESLWASRAATPLSSLPLPACGAVAVWTQHFPKENEQAPWNFFFFFF